MSEETVRRLNAGERKDAIAATFSWPERFANEPSLNPEYNRPEDISRMVAMRWTGWWDDVPGHFAALAFEEEAKEAVRLAQAVNALDRRARAVGFKSETGGGLADWAFWRSGTTTGTAVGCRCIYGAAGRAGHARARRAGLF
ncbi:MAG: hypothetical protein IPN50_12470 [Sphingomonadales bacterium]|nr:hypothetical protein [Sphingomonadales bacterium]